MTHVNIKFLLLKWFFYMMHVITCIQIQNDIASDLIIGEEGVSFCESTD